MSSPVQLWFKMKRRAGTGHLKRYHTSSDCILGTMGSALIQGPDFHFNFLLSGVDVCGESLHSLALHRPVPSSHHLLAWNPGDLVSPRADATPAVTESKEKCRAMRRAANPRTLHLSESSTLQFGLDPASGPHFKLLVKLYIHSPLEKKESRDG